MKWIYFWQVLPFWSQCAAHMQANMETCGVAQFLWTRGQPTVWWRATYLHYRTEGSINQAYQYCFKLRISWILKFRYSEKATKFEKNLPLKRSIFQTFWKLHCCAKFLFIELETSNIGYLLIFWFYSTVQSFSKIGQHW